MQHRNRGRHKAATVDVVLELARQAVAGRRFAHFVEKHAVFVQEVQAPEVFLAGFVIKREGFVSKAVQEQLANALVAPRIVRRIRYAHLLAGTNPGKRFFGRHGYTMREGDLLRIHQFVIDELGTRAVCVIGQREIADAVQVRFASQGILAQLQVGIAQEHAGAATAPQERILRRVDKGGHGLVPFFLLEIDKAYAELRPLPLDIVLELLVGKRPEADNGTVVLLLLFVFETAHPEVICVFLAVAVYFLQQRIHRLDFFCVLLCVIAVKAKRRLHPQRARLDRIEQVLELRNRFLFALQGTQDHRALFP